MTKTPSDTNPLFPKAAPDAAAPPLPAERVLPVEAILGNAREVVLLHAGQRYHLRLTSNDRLILTK